MLTEESHTVKVHTRHHCRDSKHLVAALKFRADDEHLCQLQFFPSEKWEWVCKEWEAVPGDRGGIPP